MTKEQVKKHKEVIRWWLENTDKGVWYFNNDDTDYCFWHLTHTPQFSLYYKYVQNDEYAEFRKAQADGKIVQYKGLSSQMYREMTGSDFHLHISNYRIKPEEPKFKVGDWVVNTTHAKPYKPMIVTQEMLDDKSPHNNGVHLELWSPTEGEWCVFYDEPDEDSPRDSYIISKFERIVGGKNKYREVIGRSWFNIAPLEFIQTLKEN